MSVSDSRMCPHGERCRKKDFVSYLRKISCFFSRYETIDMRSYWDVDEYDLRVRFCPDCSCSVQLPGSSCFLLRRVWYGCKIDSPIFRRTYSFQSLRLQAVECVFLYGVVGQPYSITQFTPRFFSKRTGRWRGNSEQLVIVATTGDCKRDDDDELHCLTIH